MVVTGTAAVDYTTDQDGASTPGARTGVLGGFAYLATGTVLGIVFVKSEVLSWYRIQEMFRFQSFHMFGVIAVAVAVASLSQAVLIRLQAGSATGERIQVAPKLWTPSGARYWLGGTVFGLGWALLGACPGPVRVPSSHSSAPDSRCTWCLLPRRWPARISTPLSGVVCPIDPVWYWFQRSTPC